MAVIENFAELSEKEQREFAEALIKTINSEHIFTDDADLEIYEVEATDFDGSLVISVKNTTDYIGIKRSASWTPSGYFDPREDDIEATFSDSEVDYADDAEADFKDSLITVTSDIDGYTVSLYDVMDVEEKDVSDVEVYEVTNEDDGIGSYEYFGAIGYDSDPYIVAHATVIQNCDVAFALEVLPSDKT